MYSLEYKNSTGCASEHSYYHNIVDLYTLYKDNHKVFSENPKWSDYYVVVEINNLEKEIRLLKHGGFYDTFHDDLTIGSYVLRYEDCSSYLIELLSYINEVKQMLDIDNYNVRLY